MVIGITAAAAVASLQSAGHVSGVIVAGIAAFGSIASSSDVTVTTTHLQVGRATIERGMLVR